MTIQRCVLGTVVGGLVLFFLGYLLYGILFAGFFEANAGSATGVTREPFNFVALGVGQLMWGGALTVVLGWTRTSSVAGGIKVGAAIGLLFFLGFDLTLYATTNLSNLTGAIADAVLATVLFGVTGAAVVPVIGTKAG